MAHNWNISGDQSWQGQVHAVWDKIPISITVQSRSWSKHLLPSCPLGLLLQFKCSHAQLCTSDLHSMVMVMIMMNLFEHECLLDRLNDTSGMCLGAEQGLELRQEVSTLMCRRPRPCAGRWWSMTLRRAAPMEGSHRLESVVPRSEPVPSACIKDALVCCSCYLHHISHQHHWQAAKT